jgi:hypothetical protein
VRQQGLNLNPLVGAFHHAELDLSHLVHSSGKKVNTTSLDVTLAMAKKWIEATREGKMDQM